MLEQPRMMKRDGDKRRSGESEREALDGRGIKMKIPKERKPLGFAFNGRRPFYLLEIYTFSKGNDDVTLLQRNKFLSLGPFVI